MHGLRIGLLPWLIILAVGTVGAQGFNVPSFDSNSGSTAKPVKVSFDKAGSKLRLRLGLGEGYGLSKDKRYSGVKFFAVSQGKKRLIAQKNFSGRTASADKKYYSSVNDILVPRRRFARAQKAVAEIQLLYCSFAKGVCYRKHDTLTINSPQ